MGATSKQARGPSEFTLDESVDITCINKLYEKLNTLLGSSDTVTIDAGDVQRVDTAGIQLMCCWYMEARKKGIRVSWKNSDGVFFDSARLLGLADILEF